MRTRPLARQRAGAEVFARPHAALSSIFPGRTPNCPNRMAPKSFFLTARDPHWLYAHWDLTREQQLKLNAQSSDGHLGPPDFTHIKLRAIRFTRSTFIRSPAIEFYVHVERAGNSYIAELGYYSSLGKWTRISTSSGTMTPPDAVSSRDRHRFRHHSV